MVPDGAGSFTRAMGANVLWEKERGFGEGSWRYSMVVNDGTIEKLFVEPSMAYRAASMQPRDVPV